ncbi:MAG TPA: hypothetical protein ENJ23_02600 [Bacteroidetes bacterium]|nr:hypothetical protein [Bacteroidota bacterium]
MKRKTLLLLPLFADREGILRWLGEELSRMLPLVVQLGPVLAVPPKSYRPSRGQYQAEEILQGVLGQVQAPRDYLLAVADVDLFVPGLNFVFGLADIRHRAAIISLVRLRQEFYGLKPDRNLFRQRTLKEAVHELGHLFGLPHCPNPLCVMHFSNSLSDTDRKSAHFCAQCQKRIRQIFE